MVACLQAGSSVNGWSLGWSVRKRMVKRERQQAALGVFVCGHLFTKGGLACLSLPQRGSLPFACWAWSDSAALPCPGRGRAWVRCAV